ncbi:hypothetical protein VPH35_085375 [Triticum aestivum]
MDRGSNPGRSPLPSPRPDPSWAPRRPRYPARRRPRPAVARGPCCPVLIIAPSPSPLNVKRGHARGLPPPSHRSSRRPLLVGDHGVAGLPKRHLDATRRSCPALPPPHPRLSIVGHPRASPPPLPSIVGEAPALHLPPFPPVVAPCTVPARAPLSLSTRPAARHCSRACIGCRSPCLPPPLSCCYAAPPPLRSAASAPCRHVPLQPRSSAVAPRPPLLARSGRHRRLLPSPPALAHGSAAASRALTVSCARRPPW